MDVQFRLDYLSNDEFERLFYPLVITEKEMTGGFFYMIGNSSTRRKPY